MEAGGSPLLRETVAFRDGHLLSLGCLGLGTVAFEDLAVMPGDVDDVYGWLEGAGIRPTCSTISDW
jgi:hypothetical protein